MQFRYLFCSTFELILFVEIGKEMRDKGRRCYNCKAEACRECQCRLQTLYLSLSLFLLYQCVLEAIQITCDILVGWGWQSVYAFLKHRQ